MSNTTMSLVTIGEIDKLIESIAASGEALQKKAKALALAKPITETPVDDATCQTALNAAAGVKGFLTECDREKKTAKGPLDRAGKKVLAVIEDLTAEPQKEYNRITKLVGDYQQAVQAKIAEERRKLEAERARVEVERRKLAEEAQALRESEEKARKAAAEATTKAAKAAAAKALAAIEEAKVEQEFAAADIAEAQTAVENTVIEDATMKGAAGRHDYDIEETNLSEFFAAFPQFCDITLKKTPFKEWLKIQWDGKSAIPGVKVTPKFTVAVKGVDTGLVIK